MIVTNKSFNSHDLYINLKVTLFHANSSEFAQY